MSRNISYLVTGGFGLIGSEIVNTSDGDVTIVSRTDKDRWRVNKKNVRILLKDIMQLSSGDLEHIDIIYHCASTTDNYNVLGDPYIDVETNINGTIHLLELCKNLVKKPKIIYPSTFFVYGNTYEKTKKAINEDSPTDPLALYPATKLCAENIIKLYGRLFHIPYLICRLTNVYGEHEDFDNKKKGALNYLIMSALKGNDLFLYDNGNFYRDYIYVDDVVSALRFLERDFTNERFLIGFGKPILFKDIFAYILEASKSKSSVKVIEPPDFHKIVGIGSFVADTSKITQLGWRPKITFNEGIERVIKRYREMLDSK